MPKKEEKSEGKQKLQTEYFCRLCRKWHLIKDYDLEAMKCKECASKENENK